MDQDSRIGTTLKEKWRIDALLGAGGMATVYAATHRNGKRVAIKMLHPELSRDRSVRERFAREGYVANKVGRGAVTVDDDDVTEDGAAFLVMELLDGETLEARRERAPGGRLSVHEVAALMAQVLDALARAHTQGIVHRDLKPENLFLTRDGVVKLLDFGIARLREHGASSASATATGTLMGTPAYLPPEQARGLASEVDARSDLWACGATMFTLLTGRCVHEARTVNEVLLLAMTQPAPPLVSFAPDVPLALAAVVDRALAMDQNARWPDATTMREALRTACPDAVSAPPSASVATGGLAPAEAIPAGAVRPMSGTTTTFRTAAGARTIAPGLSPKRPAGRSAWLGPAVAVGVAIVGVVVWIASAHAPAPAVRADANTAVSGPAVSPATAAPLPALEPTVRALSIADLPDVQDSAPSASPRASAHPHAALPLPATPPTPSAGATAAVAPAKAVATPPAPIVSDPFSIRR